MDLKSIGTAGSVKANFEYIEVIESRYQNDWKPIDTILLKLKNAKQLHMMDDHL